jgi:hypothetical protein
VKQISYGKQGETKNKAPKIEIMTDAMLEPSTHPRKHVKCFEDVTTDNQHQASCAE